MISGGLGGAIILMFDLGFVLLALSIAAGPIVFAIVALLLPAYLSLIGWLVLEASPAARACVLELTLTAITVLAEILIEAYIPFYVGQIISVILTGQHLVDIGKKCFGVGTGGL